MIPLVTSHLLSWSPHIITGIVLVWDILCSSNVGKPRQSFGLTYASNVCLKLIERHIYMGQKLTSNVDLHFADWHPIRSINIDPIHFLDLGYIKTPKYAMQSNDRNNVTFVPCHSLKILLERPVPRWHARRYQGHPWNSSQYEWNKERHKYSQPSI